MHRTGPVSRRGDASIRPLQTVQISSSYSPRFGPPLIANGAMSGPWPQTNKQTNLQTDAPSLNSYLDEIVCVAHVVSLENRQFLLPTLGDTYLCCCKKWVLIFMNRFQNLLLSVVEFSVNITSMLTNIMFTCARPGGGYQPPPPQVFRR